MPIQCECFLPAVLGPKRSVTLTYKNARGLAQHYFICAPRVQIGMNSARILSKTYR